MRRKLLKDALFFPGSGLVEGLIYEAPQAAKRKKVDARPRNWLIPSLLLMLREASSYGYQLTERLSALEVEAINIATVYRALRQMEKKRMVRSGWETTGGGPARRVYSITGAGEAYLESWINSLKQHRRKIEMFFRAYASSNNGSPQAPIENHDEGGKRRLMSVNHSRRRHVHP